jgi:hypothetical protein
VDFPPPHLYVNFSGDRDLNSTRESRGRPTPRRSGASASSEVHARTPRCVASHERLPIAVLVWELVVRVSQVFEDIFTRTGHKRRGPVNIVALGHPPVIVVARRTHRLPLRNVNSLHFKRDIEWRSICVIIDEENFATCYHE